MIWFENEIQCSRGTILLNEILLRIHRMPILRQVASRSEPASYVGAASSREMLHSFARA